MTGSIEQALNLTGSYDQGMLKSLGTFALPLDAELQAEPADVGEDSDEETKNLCRAIREVAADKRGDGGTKMMGKINPEKAKSCQ